MRLSLIHWKVLRTHRKRNLFGFLLPIGFALILLANSAHTEDAPSANPSFLNRLSDTGVSSEIVLSTAEATSSCSLHPDAPVTAAERRGEFDDTAHAVGVPMGRRRVERIQAQLDHAGLVIDGQEYRCDSRALRAQWQRGVEDALGGQRFLRSFSGNGEMELESPLGLTDSRREACPHPGASATNEELARMHCCRSGFLAALPELLNDIETRMPPEPDAARFPEQRSCREAFRFGELKATEACGRSFCRMPDMPCIPVRHLGCYHLGFVSHWNRNCEDAIASRGDFESWARIASTERMAPGRAPADSINIDIDSGSSSRAPASVRSGQ